MDHLSGHWVLEKSLTTGTDAMLKLQGIGWALRKAIGLASLRLDVSIEPDNTSTSEATVIDVLTTPTGGLAGTRERRVMDWTPQDHKDYLFGACQHQSRFVYGSKGEDGKVYPEIQMETKLAEEKAKKFLRGEITEDGKASEWCISESESASASGPSGLGVWVHTYVRTVSDAGWSAEQIWGFEVINGERYHTRRVVVANPKGQYVLGRLVYRFLE